MMNTPMRMTISAVTVAWLRVIQSFISSNRGCIPLGSASARITGTATVDAPMIV